MVVHCVVEGEDIVRVEGLFHVSDEPLRRLVERRWEELLSDFSNAVVVRDAATIPYHLVSCDGLYLVVDLERIGDALVVEAEV